MKVLIVFYSTYGHVYQMAEAEAEDVLGGGISRPQRRMNSMGVIVSSSDFPPFGSVR